MGMADWRKPSTHTGGPLSANRTTWRNVLFRLRVSFLHFRSRRSITWLVVACLLWLLYSKDTKDYLPEKLPTFSYPEFPTTKNVLRKQLQVMGRQPLLKHPTGHIYMDVPTLALGQFNRHPILDLIGNATRDWNQMVARQSQTLEEAVKEYRRRYDRAPPKGFDKWFRFAKENNIILTDEYDQIEEDLLPLRGVPRDVLTARARNVFGESWTYSLVIKNGKVDVAGAFADQFRAKDQRELADDFAEWLPDMNITFSVHDGPAILADYKAKNAHLTAAKLGSEIPLRDAEKVDEDAATWGYALTCPPNSRLRRAYNGLEAGQLPPGPSFIYDHLATMDLCKNPEWQYLHGFTAWQGARPTTLKPVFSYSKTVMHSDILAVPLEQYYSEVGPDPAWSKKKSKMVWRGSTTGVFHDRTSFWRSAQRTRMSWLSDAEEGSRVVRFIQRSETDIPDEKVVEREVSLASLSERYLDVGFSGELHQCNKDDGSCDAISKEITMKDAYGHLQHNSYKFMLDMDGNAWSGRFHRLMSSNACILKSTIFPEWYSKRVMPWVHYVPVKVDYTDLYDILAFFSGDMDGKNGYDDLAQQIGEHGKEWAETHWRVEDMQAYAFRLYLEYARLIAPVDTMVDHY